jgi:hypothetical protein
MVCAFLTDLVIPVLVRPVVPVSAGGVLSVCHATAGRALLIKWRVEIGKRMDIYRYMKQWFGDSVDWGPDTESCKLCEMM